MIYFICRLYKKLRYKLDSCFYQKEIRQEYKDRVQAKKDMAKFIESMGGKAYLEKCKDDNMYSMVEIGADKPWLPLGTMILDNKGIKK